ncbi:hypothetical protein [Ruegeria sp. HKCCD6428]|uniref:hypothetical protein n=1 Tax=Ruegeria sp. HKCCD6428 TaxID=2683002 RepID=UPI001490C7E1|nr:hypothetical protein [Ruegeria sp. HKCCD6428]NOC83836.1 hypothetical protein [Ruegeria sp. HKCCD6428]
METLDIIDTKSSIEQIVWSYSEFLQTDTDPDELKRFQSVLANMLLRSSHNELKRHPRRNLSVENSEELARRKSMETAVQAGIAESPHLVPLPNAIAFWPVNANDKPIKLSKKLYGPRLRPTALEGKKPKSIFTSKENAHRIGYFEFDERPKDLPLVTSAIANPRYLKPKSKAKILPALAFGAIGLILLVFSMSAVYATGDLIGVARNQISDAEAQDVQKEKPENWSNLRAALQKKCKPPKGSAKGPDLGGLCKANVLDIDSYAKCITAMAPSEEKEVSGLTPACNAVWREALLLADTKEDLTSESWGGFFNRAAVGLESLLSFARLTSKDINESGALSLAAYAYLSMVSLVLLVCAFGYGISGRWCGLVISDQNRISLSLSQITAWSIVLLSSYAVYASFNIGSRPGFGTADVSLLPALPAWTWAVMGITVGAPFASSLIKGNAPEGWEEHFGAATDATGKNFEVRALDNQNSEEDARLIDLITSEQLGKADHLAITRVQNVAITAILLFTYTAWLVGSISALLPNVFLSAFAQNEAILSSFPEPDATFTALLALSHGAYLLGKFQPAAKGDADP